MAEQGELAWLQQWYLSCCDGSWEHSYGVRVDTLDNPGWALKIDLPEGIDAATFTAFERHRSESEWLVCRIEEESFAAYCGPTQLSDAIQVFRSWIESLPK